MPLHGRSARAPHGPSTEPSCPRAWGRARGGSGAARWLFMVGLAAGVHGLAGRQELHRRGPRGPVRKLPASGGLPAVPAPDRRRRPETWKAVVAGQPRTRPGDRGPALPRGRPRRRAAGCWGSCRRRSSPSTATPSSSSTPRSASRCSPSSWRSGLYAATRTLDRGEPAVACGRRSRAWPSRPPFASWGWSCCRWSCSGCWLASHGALRRRAASAAVAALAGARPPGRLLRGRGARRSVRRG